MKVILINYSAEILKDVAFELQKKSVEIVYRTGAKDDFDKFKKDRQSFPNTVFHDYFDAVKGIGAPEVDVSSFPVPGRDLLAKLAPCEAMLMPMINRLDFTETFTVQQRQRLYHEYVRYWHGILTKYKPDAIIFSSIPHIVYNYVIYCLAKELGIKTIIHRSLQIASRILLFQDFQKYESIEKIYAQMSDQHYTIEDIGADIRAYYEAQSGVNQSAPWYRQKKYMNKRARQMALLPSWSGLVKAVVNFDFLAKLKTFFKPRRLLSLDGQHYSFWQFKKYQWLWRQKRLGFKKEYLSLVKEVDLDKKFIYVPLGTQPEMSTNPLGGIYDDQILMIETLAQVIPDDWQIYVKETPTQWTWRFSHLGRWAGYYHKLNRMKNVSLVSVDLSSAKLTKQCQTVATITGTAGLEAVLRGQQALIFGYPWFLHCDGIFRIDGEVTARQAMGRIQDGYKPNKQMVINYLKAIDQATVQGYFYKKFKVNKELTYEQNVVTIAEAIYSEMKK